MAERSADAAGANSGANAALYQPDSLENRIKGTLMLQIKSINLNKKNSGLLDN